MKINAKQPSIKAYTLSHFKIGDVCMGVRDEHYYLVVKSEKEKKQQAWEDTWQQVLDGMKAQKGNTHDQNLKR